MKYANTFHSKKMNDALNFHSKKTKNYKFTIIVPVYNEQDNLPRVEKELIKFMKIAIMPTNILFINDGSTDKSEAIIVSICKNNLDFDFISFPDNKGLSSAIKAGFDIIQTDYIGYMDSDLQTTPLDFNLLLDHIKENDLVTGVRENRKDSFVKILSSTIANLIRRSFTRDGMDDTGCPLKVIKTPFAKRIPMFKGLHRFLPAMVLLQKGKVKQIRVQHFPRIAGRSKYSLWNRILGPLTDCFAYLWMKKKYINYNVSNSSNE